MSMKQRLEGYLNRYCAYSFDNGCAELTFIRVTNSLNESALKKHCQLIRKGIPGQLLKIEDDCVYIKFLYGYDLKDATVPFDRIIIYEDPL